MFASMPEEKDGKRRPNTKLFGRAPPPFKKRQRTAACTGGASFAVPTRHWYKRSAKANISAPVPLNSGHWCRLDSNEFISTFHEDAVDHALGMPAARATKGAEYQRRFSVTLPHPTDPKSGDVTHIFVLSASSSEAQTYDFPDKSKDQSGIFLTYRGPHANVILPNHIDLGCYGPLSSDDIKSGNLMKVKNFLYSDAPSKYSFGIPSRMLTTADNDTSSTGTPNYPSITIRGKMINKYSVLDMTDDSTGRLHERVERTLFPFANNVVVRGVEGSQRFRELQERRRLDAVHHNDGSLHFLLRSGFKYTAGETTELFVDFGAKHENAKLCNKLTNEIPSSYTEMRQIVNLLTSHDVEDVLDLFLQRAPVQSVPRQRMHWLLKHLGAYIETKLWEFGGRREHRLRINAKYEEACKLFPRPPGDPYHEEDLEIRERHRRLGTPVRFIEGRNGYHAGFVEELVKDTINNECKNLQEREQKYLVVYHNGNGERVVTDQEIQENRFRILDFGMKG